MVKRAYDDGVLRYVFEIVNVGAAAVAATVAGRFAGTGTGTGTGHGDVASMIADIGS